MEVHEVIVVLVFLGLAIIHLTKAEYLSSAIMFYGAYLSPRLKYI